MTNTIRAYRKYLTINDIVYDYNLVRFRHLGGNIIQPFYVNAPNVQAGANLDYNLPTNIIYYNDTDTVGISYIIGLSIVNSDLLCAHLNFIAKDSNEEKMAIERAYIALNNSFATNILFTRYDKKPFFGVVSGGKIQLAITYNYDIIFYNCSAGSTVSVASNYGMFWRDANNTNYQGFVDIAGSGYKISLAANQASGFAYFLNRIIECGANNSLNTAIQVGCNVTGYFFGVV